MKIGLMSDTHGWYDPAIEQHFAEVDEIWHAGDIGDLKVIADLKKMGKPLRAVYGNIDGAEARQIFPEDWEAEVEGVRVWMTHIGGYPGRYSTRVRDLLRAGKQCDLFICGHSHICKVMRDDRYQMLTMNPGACGFHGFHKYKTVLRFELKEGKVLNLEAIEMGRRGSSVL